MVLTDFHCHILPDLDDGSRSLKESLEMARMLAEVGFQRVCCTPHWIRGSYDTTPDQVERSLDALQKEMTAEGIPLVLLPGMEYYLDEHFPSQLDAPRPLGNSRLLLVEAPSQAPPEMVLENLFQVVRKGFIPLFAHPERCGWLTQARAQKGFKSLAKKVFAPQAPTPLQDSPHLDSLQRMGSLLQGNLGSFAGHYGATVRGRAHYFRAAKHFACFGTDAHSSTMLERIFRSAETRDLLAETQRPEITPP